jgi:hypothetical protein
MRVVSDIVDGDVRLASRQDSARRFFQVHELTGAAAARLHSATQASGIPRVGDPHPVIPGVSVLEVRATSPGDPSIAVIEATYGVPTAADIGGSGGAVEIAINGDLITEETVTDVNGSVITTSHTQNFVLSGTTGSGFAPGTPGVNGAVTQTQVHRVEVQRPTFSVTYTRVEKRPPLGRARRYAGKVNGSRFLNEDADKWLVNLSSSQEAADKHRVRYTFTLNPNGWQAIISHQRSGVVPVDVSATNGQTTVQVYERENFSALGLPSI